MTSSACVKMSFVEALPSDTNRSLCHASPCFRCISETVGTLAPCGARLPSLSTLQRKQEWFVCQTTGLLFDFGGGWGLLLSCGGAQSSYAMELRRRSVLRETTASSGDPLCLSCFFASDGGYNSGSPTLMVHHCRTKVPLQKKKTS